MDGKELQGHNFHRLFLLLLSVVAPVSGDSPVPVSGFVGKQVVLPCTYNGNVPLSDLMVIWWTATFEMLYKFTNGKDDLREQDPRFRNRTKLFKDQLEQGNWSVLLSDLRESDQSQYMCQIYKKKEEINYLVKFDLLHLFVTVCPTPGSSESPAGDQQQFNTTQGPGLSTRGGVGLAIGILVAVFVVAGIGIGIYIFLKRWKQNTHTINRNESSNGVLLTEVTCPGETRGFVTAPEHQDGAAGEQNLRNGTVQALSFHCSGSLSQSQDFV